MKKVVEDSVYGESGGRYGSKTGLQKTPNLTRIEISIMRGVM